MENLFSYGTLQKDKVQKELFGRTLNGSVDLLPGFKIGSVEIKDASVLQKSQQQFHPIAIPSDPEDVIEGMVLEITPEELKMADSYETSDYKRVEVKLHSGKLAWAYVAKNKGQ